MHPNFARITGLIASAMRAAKPKAKPAATSISLARHVGTSTPTRSPSLAQQVVTAPPRAGMVLAAAPPGPPLWRELLEAAVVTVVVGAVVSYAVTRRT
jgi:hypothetical protein